MATETPMTTNDVAALNAKIDALSTQLALLVEQQKKRDELFREMSPILKEVMATATTQFGDLEKKGYFAFGKELLGVLDRVVTGFSPDDIRALGTAVVGILDTARQLTQPEVLTVASEAAEVIQHADQVEPVGLLGVVRASRDTDVQRGMAVMMEVLRHVGRGAQVIEQKQAETPEARRRKGLASATAPKRGKKVLGVERTPAPRPAPRPHVAAVAPVAPAGPVCAPESAARAAAAPVAATIDGVGFTADGHLADPSVWTRELGEKIAASLGMAMTDEHWKICEAARADYLERKASPNIRRLNQVTGAETKALYALFPKAPARTIAKIAGIPKPAGCL